MLALCYAPEDTPFSERDSLCSPELMASFRPRKNFLHGSNCQGQLGLLLHPALDHAPVLIINWEFYFMHIPPMERLWTPAMALISSGLFFFFHSSL